MATVDRDLIRDLAARVAVGALFVLLSANVLAEFVRTHHLTGLLLLMSEGLVVVLTITRRRTAIVDRSLVTAAVTAVSFAGPPLLRANGHAALLPDLVTAGISAAGLALVVAGKVSLGRSFGIIPANRGVVVRGPYTVIRHPIYVGYLITHVAFVLAHPIPWNVIVCIVADSALIARSLMEERVLTGDDRYRAYCGRVPWHLVPGVF